MTEFVFYREKYHGDSVPETEWNRFAQRAQAQLERYKRIYTVTAPEENSEAMALCAMADALYYFECAANGNAGTVSAASVGSVSVSYQNVGAVDLSRNGQERELYRCARLYLDIYRGCGG